MSRCRCSTSSTRPASAILLDRPGAGRAGQERPRRHRPDAPPGRRRRLLTRLTGTAPPRAQAKWDPRTYGIGAQILRDLGVTKMRLLSSPRKMPSMTGFDLEVTGFVTSPAEL
jgi:hypothetical protein